MKKEPSTHSVKTAKNHKLRRTWALIYIGSLELTLNIYQTRQEREPKLLETLSLTQALGSELYRNGDLSETMVQTLMKNLRQLALKLQEYPACELRVLAASALAEMEKWPLVAEQIRLRFGFKVELLSANEGLFYEQRSLLSQMPDLQKWPGASMALALRSGSIDVALYEAGSFCYAQTMPLGALRVREIMSELLEHSSEPEALLKAYIHGDLAYFKNFERPNVRYRQLLVMGTVLDPLRQVFGWKREGTLLIKREAFRRQLRDLQTYALTDEALAMGIDRDFAGMILPAALVIDEAFNYCDLDCCYLTPATLEEGAAASFQGASPDPFAEQFLNSSVRYLTDRFMNDREHTAVVAKLALQLFDQLKKWHGLNLHDRQLLKMAADLHNIGKYLSMQSDDHLSAEIVRSATLPALAKREQHFLADLVRYHNGRIDWRELQARWDAETSAKLCKMVALLCLANTLDASHAQRIQGLSVKEKNKKILLYLEAEEHPALELWTFKRHQQLFIDSFGFDLEIRMRREKREGLRSL